MLFFCFFSYSSVCPDVVLTKVLLGNYTVRPRKVLLLSKWLQPSAIRENSRRDETPPRAVLWIMKFFLGNVNMMSCTVTILKLSRFQFLLNPFLKLFTRFGDVPLTPQT